MIEKNIGCIESSLPISEVIKIFINKEERKKVIEFKEDKKQDISEDSILLFDNYMNQSLPHSLLNISNTLIVRLTNFEHWKKNATNIELQHLSLLTTSEGKLVDFSN
ncbi:hypothetical protein [uncultured Vagococcus sp.]|uniref:hypothetical protein n=1 Tax=uncultured Vagococcus sp. TaxID=189676 RepID=UPI002584DA06|nr:hypothetical protein [uncultured Vagococcus sp.]